MKKTLQLFLVGSIAVGSMSSCVSKKKFASLQLNYDASKKQLAQCDSQLADYLKNYNDCDAERSRLRADLQTLRETSKLKEEQVGDLKSQVEDLKKSRDKQVEQVGNLTVLTASANENIKETLAQLEKKDKYIQALQSARTKSDSINLALSINLKGVLKEGLSDDDVEIKVDKTVVMINLSDKMLFNSGSATLTSKANDVLGKIATIIKSRPDFEVMVEGYTDNLPISNSCLTDNWDLSVKRSTSVVRKMQKDFGIDPNRLIAAGRGEYNKLAPNDTADGRSKNRRTRIIIMPKIDQFYDLLDPDKAAAKLK